MTTWKDLESAYGTPERTDFTIPLGEAEFATLLASTRQVRFQDATMLIFNPKGQLACIRKHGYPEGIFRPPSGLVNKGESIEQAAHREALEETGLEIELERYLLRASVYFRSDQSSLLWTTHVFRTRLVSGILQTQDPLEIAEVDWLDLQQLRALSPRMASSGRGGLLYRAQLMDVLLSHPELTGPKPS